MNKIIYRSENIFTLFLEKDKNLLGLNFLHCFSLIENGIVGNIITNYSISSLGMSHIFYCQKFQLKASDYSSHWIQTVDSNGNEHELIAACRKMEVSPDLNLYNRISDDKY